MVNYYYEDTNNVLTNFASEIVGEIKKAIEKVCDCETGIQFSGVTPTSLNGDCGWKRLILETIKTRQIFSDSQGFSTPHEKFMCQGTPYIQLWEINGNRTISLRKLTHLSDEKHDKLIEECDKIISYYQDCVN